MAQGWTSPRKNIWTPLLICASVLWWAWKIKNMISFALSWGSPVRPKQIIILCLLLVLLHNSKEYNFLLTRQVRISSQLLPLVYQLVSILISNLNNMIPCVFANIKHRQRRLLFAGSCVLFSIIKGTSTTEIAQVYCPLIPASTAFAGSVEYHPDQLLRVSSFSAVPEIELIEPLKVT